LVFGEENQTYTPETSGPFAVEITQNGCVDTLGCSEINITSIISHNDFGRALEVYPNPSKSHLTVYLGGYYEEVSLNIISSTGYVLHQQNCEKRSEFTYD
jgi:hypothetical protein